MLPPIERVHVDPSLPLVTIVTPSYNHARFIAETIESVLSQDYPNIEYIVMDGASKDDTAGVVAPYEDRLTFISEKDRGQSHAINKGFQMARGQIVAWLNSDDLFLPGAIRRAVEAFVRNPKLGFVYGKGFQVDVEGKVISEFHVAQEFDLWKLVHLSDYVLQQTAFFRRSVFETVGWLDESLYYGMDWEIFMRIGKATPVEFLPYEMGSIREHGEAKTSVGGLRRVRELRDVMRRHSGDAWPPGTFVYGLPVVRDLAVEAIARRLPPGFLRRKLTNAAIRATNALAWQILSRASGHWADGWAGRRVRLMLAPSDSPFVRLAVELPEWMPFDRQRLHLHANGRTIARESFGHGRFEIDIVLDEADRGRALTLKLDAERSFRPSRLGASTDRRALSYLLHAVTTPG